MVNRHMSMSYPKTIFISSNKPLARSLFKERRLSYSTGSSSEIGWLNKWIAKSTASTSYFYQRSKYPTVIILLMKPLTLLYSDREMRTSGGRV